MKALNHPSSWTLENLVNEIISAAETYYVDRSYPYTDQEFDEMIKELKQRDSNHPLLKSGEVRQTFIKLFKVNRSSQISDPETWWWYMPWWNFDKKVFDNLLKFCYIYSVRKNTTKRR